jgi:hypothetical protein
MYSQFLVRVSAHNEVGAELRARISLQLLNLDYQDLLKFGIVKLVGESTPRFPSLAADGVVRQRFNIWHHYWRSVRLQKIRVLRLDLAGERRDYGDTIDMSVLSRDEIGVGESIQADLSLDTRQYPAVLALIFRLEGLSDDGRPVLGEIAVMRPPPKPSRENGDPLRDPFELQRVRMALKLLGTDTVSLEDLWQLERAGQIPRRGAK